MYSANRAVIITQAAASQPCKHYSWHTHPATAVAGRRIVGMEVSVLSGDDSQVIGEEL